MERTEYTRPTIATLTAATLGLAIGWAIIGPTQDPRTTPPTATVQTVAQLPAPTTIDPDRAQAQDAWRAWDAARGWRYLKANPDVENRVEYVGMATRPPYVDESAGYGVIPGKDSRWYVFRAVPVDLADTGTTTTSATIGK